MKRIYSSKAYKQAWGNRNWSEVPGTINFELMKIDPNNWVVESDKRPLGPAISQYLNSVDPNSDVEDAYFEIQIEYSATGSEEQGVHTLPNGDPGYPGYSDNENILTDVKILNWGQNGGHLSVPQQLHGDFSTVFEDDIESDESWIEGSYDSYEPDYDPDY